MSFTKTLTRDEMKNVMAGTGCEGTCLFCYTSSGGYEGWYREDTSAPAGSECRDIYNSEDAQGEYHDCGSAPGSIPIHCN